MAGLSLHARLLIAAALVLGAIAGWWRLTAHYEATGYRRAQAEAEARALAAAQADRIRDLQRAAELRYTVAAETRERFIVTTVKEVRHVAAHLDSCPLGPAAVGLLNDAAACARGAAACGPDQPVPSAP